ncbi:ABC transporter substrate-binding protein [Allofournierella sp.]|uniref:ABC transporter substrate-binding protein n=1 Tax=Allofournierella sp. TaxID=1940256 RepID=UPI002E76C276|nr:extracellular solute-binding protein [Fournierella sp.]MEE0757819.1 extracellular solute-binding protein [Fournierella sp.]
MKKRNVVISALLAGLMSISVCGCGSTPAASGGTSGSEAGVTQYPAGTLTIYMNGNPQYRQQYFETWLEEHRDIAPEVEVEFVQVESNADAREKVTMTALAGATEDLPDAVFLDRLNLMDLVEADLLLDETEFLSPLVDKMVDGAVDEGIVQEKMYGLPDSVRPQLLMYNKAIFDQYGIDPEMMATMDGYIEAGRQLKEKSNGEVYLSWIGSNDMTWKCWGRRGLMPQANAKIWDDEGNVVIGQDEGTKLALGTLDTLYSEGLLMRVEMYDPAMYDATNNHQIATYYLGAYWDEFMRQNCQATAGEWRVMSAPVFEEVGTAGAPVSSYMCIVNKGEDTVYQGLLEQIWHDYTFDSASRMAWTESMEEQNAPYSNPISLEMLEDEFWKEPSDYYGGQSFREWEALTLQNGSVNLIVTPQDAEGDTIISAEIEKYVAGSQTMEQAIANMDANLKAKIGTAEVVK